MGRFLLLAAILSASFSPRLAYAQAAAGQLCADLRPAPVHINIELELPKPYYDFQKTIAEINRDRSTMDEWLVRNGMQKVWKSQEMTKLGYADGGAALVSGLGMMARYYDRYGAYYCTYISKLELAMMFRTRIVIPKEFKNGGCRFNMIHEHEYRHYQANRDVTEEFVKRLYKDLPVIIADIENRQPYVQKSEVPQAFKRLQENIKLAIESYIIESMREEMKRRNSLIDTPEEYASTGPKLRACKD